MNVVRMVLDQAKSWPDAPALVDAGRIVTYGEIADTVRRCAGHLAGLDLRPGDRVGLCLKDHWQHLAVFLAIALAGLVVVPLDWRARAAEKSGLARLTSLALIVVEPGDPIATTCPVVTLDEIWHGAQAHKSPFDDIIDDVSAPMIIAATSGTTGPARFSVATHGNVQTRTAIVIQAVPAHGEVRCLSSSPLYFVGGHLRCLAHLFAGECVVLHAPLFTAEEYVAAVRRHAITLGVAVPSVVRQLLAAARGTWLLPETMGLLATGAPLDGTEKQLAARTLTPRFYEAYGNSLIGNISVLRPVDLERHADSVGRPHPLTEVQSVDDEDRPLAANEVGRLRVRGPGLGAPLELPGADSGRAEILRDGWYYPGELGTIDEAGYLYIKGRTSEVIMRGGAKIDPAEVEAVLRRHPLVVEAAVISGKDANNEESVVAFVVARGSVGTGELLAHCRARLTPYKVPQAFHAVAALPRNTAGKVVKGELAALLDKLSQTPTA